MITVRYFAAAAEAAGTDSEPLEAASVAEARRAAVSRHGDQLEDVWARCSVLVDGVRSADPHAPVPSGATVDVLPPFAGG
ncbi:MoaD/ThiS family protein [Cellulomonas bogoriensis]|uniref:Molybdopterin converting factor n=1 Tax=Cellulomonas bogoriensis 69B4 = DSM 16987 TaxID=1386082 RepID=A0A0A0C068_9CELL|nr:MoaD/ThiS family protein [Cellulomonas bogoriensis]KGM14063.1 molybdopterin converting factor [Cellulomonas bogoriensis 69B4 = DSM 16987]